MSFATDNRYSPGASGATVPDSAIAAYSARWIDQGWGPADIVPDRQGVAFNDQDSKERLFEVLGTEQPHKLVAEHRSATDVVTQLVSTGQAEVWIRRAGGYIYVDAWVV